MKTKKYLIAIAIFGGVLFTAQAANAYSIDGKEAPTLKKRSVKTTDRK